MDLTTRYLGLTLANPIMPGASPLADDPAVARQLEDQGAAAIVMHSLFEEQLAGRRTGDVYQREIFADSAAETAGYFPSPDEYAHGPDRYLEQLGKLKETLSIPVIASLNGTSRGGWIDYARQLQQAGADALELNLHQVSTDPNESSAEVEDRLVEVVQAVRKSVSVPIAVKLSPFFTSLPNLCCRIEAAGADGLVLFDRYEQPDIDPEERDVVPELHLSEPWELHLRLRWLAVVSPLVRCSLAASGGIHDGAGALKALMAGAHAVQVVSAILRHGPAQVAHILDELRTWMEQNQYSSLRRLQGSMNMRSCPDASAFQRGQYVRVLQSRKTPQR